MPTVLKYGSLSLLACKGYLYLSPLIEEKCAVYRRRGGKKYETGIYLHPCGS
jgi:hypothetical protein